jgi:hypothetical protein
MQNRPQQPEIDTALTTFKTTLDGITKEAAGGGSGGATGGATGTM